MNCWKKYSESLLLLVEDSVLLESVESEYAYIMKEMINY